MQPDSETSSLSAVDCDMIEENQGMQFLVDRIIIIITIRLLSQLV